MKKSIINSRGIIGERLYYCAFVYAIILSFLMSANYVPLLAVSAIRRLIYLAVAMMFFKIYAIDRFELRRIFYKSVILLLAIISWRLARGFNVLLYVSFILGAENVKFRRLIELFFGTVGILLAGTVLISQASIIKDFVYVRDKFHRHSLGIGYPTDMAAYVFYLLLAYYYLHFKQLTWRTYVTVIVLDMIVYGITQARNSFVLILLTIPVVWIAQHASQYHRISRGVASFYWMVVPLAAYCTILLSWLYNKQLRAFILLDRALSGRLNLSHYALQKYGISIFGQHVHENGWGGYKGLKHFNQAGFSYFYIDSSYIRLAVIYGILLGILIIIFMTIIAYRSTLNHEYILAAIIMLVSLHCIVEQHLIDFNYNPFLLALLSTTTLNKTRIIQKTGGNHDSKQ